MFATSASILDATRRPFLEQFQLVCENASLLTSKETDIGRAEGSQWNLVGVYLWSVITGNSPSAEHVVYIGKTRSFRRRVQEYRRGFQAHSPNDYKLQVFQHVVHDKDELATFRLYFRSVPVEEITATENDAVERFDPVLNRRAPVSSEARSDFQRAFERYYTAGFNAHFTANSDA